MEILYYFINLAAGILLVNAYRIHHAKKGLEIKEKKDLPFIVKRLLKQLQKAGCSSTYDMIFYLSFPLIGLIASVYSFISGNVSEGIVLALAPVFISFFMLAAKKHKYDSIFQKNAYKLYKYILNQVQAGVRPGDAMKNMYEVIEEKNLRKVFAEACAKYSVSLNGKLLANEITDKIDTPEARSFAMSIRDGLFENRDEKLMDRLEQLMFNRYFAYVQRMTDGVKTKCLITVVLLCLIIVGMILVPTIMDVQNALNSIFSQ